jgi:cholestenol delta-isomerase
MWWGPLGLCAAAAIPMHWPSRHVLQTIVSVGEIYGLVLYFWTEIFEGGAHSRPEAFYYYFYYVFMNILWLVMPTFLLIQSCRFLTAVVREDIRRKSKKRE